MKSKLQAMEEETIDETTLNDSKFRAVSRDFVDRLFREPAKGWRHPLIVLNRTDAPSRLARTRTRALLRVEIEA